nr:MAG TPA: zinc finger protein [Caudoviricetes sp.]
MKYRGIKFLTCDFCEKFKDVVTEVDCFYICSDCAKDILENCIKNERENKKDSE